MVDLPEESSSSDDGTVKTFRPGRKPSRARIQSQAYIKKRKNTSRSSTSKQNSDASHIAKTHSDTANSDATIE